MAESSFNGGAMKLGSKEHYEIMDQFEKEFYHMRLDREKNKEWQLRGNIYESGETNALFKAYRQGYSFCKSLYMR